MPRTQVSCPNCRQPVVVDVEQLFDASEDPSAKQKLLAGAFNLIQCPNCGYQGNLATPIVYHDADKELLLTYMPPEIGLPRDEQEKLIGSLINQAVNKLPPEKRKAYILRPQTTLTIQGLIERILEADGITKEMIEAQQKKINLIQRLLSATDDVLAEIIRQEDHLIDAEFFALLSRLAEAAAASGDREGTQKIIDLQNKLVPATSYGRHLQEQTQEVEAAVASLQEAGEGLTREKLLELVIKAPNESRVQAFVSLARPGMDYQFFQLLSDRIDRARGEGRKRLINLRDNLLEMTRKIDEQVEQRRVLVQRMIDTILQAPDVKGAMTQNLGAIDEFFVQELGKTLEAAREEGDLEKISKLQTMMEVIQEASAPPPEMVFIDELLQAPDDNARRQLFEANKDKVSPEFIGILTSIINQLEESDQPELTAAVKALHRQALRFSMETQLRG